MTTLSVRDIAARRLAATGDLSLNADVYGYVYRDESSRLFGSLRETDILPGAGSAASPTRRSLKRHLERVSGECIDLVIFLVGHEPDFSGVVSLDEVTKFQYALQVARDLYAQVGLGVRRIDWDRIPVDDAGGFADITSVIGASSLTKQASGRPNAIDIFVVQTMGAKTGRSPNPGPCVKAMKGPMDGCVMEVAGFPDEVPITRQYLGITLTHEVGHYLGLDHVPEHDNVMCGPTIFHGKCVPSEEMLDLTSDQGDHAKNHCMVLPAG